MPTEGAPGCQYPTGFLLEKGSGRARYVTRFGTHSVRVLTSQAHKFCDSERRLLPSRKLSPTVKKILTSFGPTLKPIYTFVGITQMLRNALSAPSQGWVRSLFRDHLRISSIFTSPIEPTHAGFARRDPSPLLLPMPGKADKRQPANQISSSYLH